MPHFYFDVGGVSGSHTSPQADKFEKASPVNRVSSQSSRSGSTGGSTGGRVKMSQNSRPNSQRGKPVTSTESATPSSPFPGFSQYHGNGNISGSSPHTNPSSRPRSRAAVYSHTQDDDLDTEYMPDDVTSNNTRRSNNSSRPNTGKKKIDFVSRNIQNASRGYSSRPSTSLSSRYNNIVEDKPDDDLHTKSVYNGGTSTNATNNTNTATQQQVRVIDYFGYKTVVPVRPTSTTGSNNDNNGGRPTSTTGSNKTNARQPTPATGSTSRPVSIATPQRQPKPTSAWADSRPSSSYNNTSNTKHTTNNSNPKDDATNWPQWSNVAPPPNNTNNNSNTHSTKPVLFPRAPSPSTSSNTSNNNNNNNTTVAINGMTPSPLNTNVATSPEHIITPSQSPYPQQPKQTKPYSNLLLTVNTASPSSRSASPQVPEKTSTSTTNHNNPERSTINNTNSAQSVNVTGYTVSPPSTSSAQSTKAASTRPNTSNAYHSTPTANNTRPSSTRRGDSSNELQGYQLMEVIGEGTFGTVRKAIHIKSGLPVAVKTLIRARMTAAGDAARVQREIDLLRQVDHANVVAQYEVQDTPNAIYLIMEYCSRGPLFDYIVSKGKLAEREACACLHHILNGLDHIHYKGITHRDLKPENLQLNDNLTVKIADLGLGNRSNAYNDNQLRTACGSPCYAAPEMLHGRKYEGPVADMWSLGVVLFALLCGYLPFEHANTSKLYTLIKQGSYTVPSHVSAGARDLLSRLLNVHPQHRWTHSKIRTHPWYLGLTVHTDPTEYQQREDVLDMDAYHLYATKNGVCDQASMQQRLTDYTYDSEMGSYLLCLAKVRGQREQQEVGTQQSIPISPKHRKGQHFTFNSTPKHTELSPTPEDATPPHSTPKPPSKPNLHQFQRNHTAK